MGAIAGAGVLFVIASGQAGFDVSAGFASNGYGDHSPGGYTMVSALVRRFLWATGLLGSCGCFGRTNCWCDFGGRCLPLAGQRKRLNRRVTVQETKSAGFAVRIRPVFWAPFGRLPFERAGGVSAKIFFVDWGDGTALNVIFSH